MNKGTSISAKDFEKLAKEYPIMYIINSPTTKAINVVGLLLCIGRYF